MPSPRSGEARKLERKVSSLRRRRGSSIGGSGDLTGTASAAVEAEGGKLLVDQVGVVEATWSQCRCRMQGQRTGPHPLPTRQAACAARPGLLPSGSTHACAMRMAALHGCPKTCRNRR